MAATTLVNGQPSHTLETQDRGLAYGDGVFETIALSHGQVQLWQRHRQRLITGLMRLGIVTETADAQHLVAALISDIQTAYHSYNSPQGVIKLTVTRGCGGRGYAAPSTPSLTRIVSILPWPTNRSHLSTAGVRVKVCQHRWSTNVALSGIKHLNRLDQVMARNEWTDSEFHEGIMLDQEGHVISGVMSNLFIETQGALITPKLDQCGIAGTMADEVRAIAAQSDIDLVQREISLDELINADAAFITNSLNGIWPIIELLPQATEQHTGAIGWPVSPLIKKLQSLLLEHLSKQLPVEELC